MRIGNNHLSLVNLLFTTILVSYGHEINYQSLEVGPLGRSLNKGDLSHGRIFGSIGRAGLLIVLGLGNGDTLTVPGQGSRRCGEVINYRVERMDRT